MSELERLKARNKVLESACATLAEALQKHHDHDSNAPCVHFADEANPPSTFDKQLPTNLGEAYQESQLWDDTRDALSLYNGLKGKL